MSEPRSDYNAGYRASELPAGIERAMLRLLEFHVGRTKAISRGDMVQALKSTGFPVSEREARQVINELRKQGHPICSTGGENGGYWLAADWEELNEYRQHELQARAFDLLEQDKALQIGAEKRWGRFSPEKQARMEL